MGVGLKSRALGNFPRRHSSFRENVKRLRRAVNQGGLQSAPQGCSGGSREQGPHISVYTAASKRAGPEGGTANPSQPPTEAREGHTREPGTPAATLPHPAWMNEHKNRPRWVFTASHVDER